MKKKQKILILVGPTSSGKSSLAVELARKFNGEVISADSRQVYRGLNIGTGKITNKEMKGVPHHILDVAWPSSTFTAHDFVQQGRVAITEIATRGKLPIVTGGTGFYIDVLVGRINLPDVPANKKLRGTLEKKSVAQLFASLKKKDPRRANTIDPHNKVRLIRALEIAAALGRVPMIEIRSQSFDALWIGITLQSSVLVKKIRTRLIERMKAGMVREAKRLHAAGLSYKRMESFGLEYRALARFLQGKITRAEMVDGLDRDIRRYAKRQLTYWQRNKDIKWFAPKESQKISKIVQRWLRG